MPAENGDRYFPPEVWKECFDYLQSSDLKSLALTCRIFRDISAPSLFSSFTFVLRVVDHIYGTNVFGPGDLVFKEHAKHLRELAQHPYAAFVRKLSLKYTCEGGIVFFDENRFDPGDEAFDLFADEYERSVPAFVNLRHMHVLEFQTCVDDPFMTSLVTLQHLQKIQFGHFYFEKPKLPLHLKVTDLEIQHQLIGRKPLKVNIFSAERLEKMSVDAPCLAPGIFRSLRKQGGCAHLVRLSFRLDYLDLVALYDFLEKCPRLEFMDVTLVRFDDTEEVIEHLQGVEFPCLPRSKMPKLKYFTGPDCIARAFVPGRPVETVALRSSPDMKREFSDVDLLFDELGRSTSTLVELAIEGLECTPEALNLIDSHFPSLKSLGMDLLGSQSQSLDENETALVGAVGVAAHSSAEVVESQENASSTESLCRCDDMAYLDVLRDAALELMDFPRSLETLSLRMSSKYMVFSTRCSGICKAHEGKSPADNTHGLTKAKSIFSALSNRLPTLKKINLYSKETEEDDPNSVKVIWEKDIRTSHWNHRRI